MLAQEAMQCACCDCGLEVGKTRVTLVDQRFPRFEWNKPCVDSLFVWICSKS